VQMGRINSFVPQTFLSAVSPTFESADRPNARMSVNSLDALKTSHTLQAGKPATPQTGMSAARA